MTVNSTNTGPGLESWAQANRIPAAAGGGFLCLSLLILLLPCPARGQIELTPPGTAASLGRQFPGPQLPGSISGSVVDPSGAAVARAHVELKLESQSAAHEALTSEDGQFSFGNILPGPFQLTIAAEGFAAQTLSGILHEGEMFNAPRIALTLATKKTEMRVEAPAVEIAEEQIKEEEKQRVLGIVPNFYVSYVPDAAPLTPRQKFELAWKVTVDPVTFVVNGGVAGLQQANNSFAGYGQGAQGYGKRYGADYANVITNTMIGNAILPSLLKQDPRYFYKGSGSTRSRVLYAIANSVICKGDNGRWQPNYSDILGGLASGGISNLYYPAQDRHGAALTFENAAIEIGATAVVNLLQEFVIRKLTSNPRSHDPAKP